MSALLELARDYLDRMANPVYGLATNEEYSLRFGKLLQTEGFENALRREVSETQNTEALTSHGWLWLIGWAKATDVELSENVLEELFDKWSNVFAKTEILDLATVRYDGPIPRRTPTLELFPDEFLGRIMLSSVGDSDEAAADAAVSTDRAEDALTALLQVGRPITLKAASALLRYHWRGQQRLNDYFWAMADSLDEPTRAEWLKAVEPPERDRKFEI